MLRRAWVDTKNLYYDPTFHGLDLDALYHRYDGALDHADSVGESLRLVASFLAEFHDSHLYLIPPDRGALYMADFNFRMIGDRCYITQVKPGSEAARKLHIGDKLVELNGFAIKRNNISDVRYYFRELAPRSFDDVTVRGIDGTLRSVQVDGEMLPRAYSSPNWRLHDEEDARRYRQRYIDTGKIVIWKMPGFDFDPGTLDPILNAARKRSALIIDLRGNPGGSVDSLEVLVGRLFDHTVKIAELVARKPQKPMLSQRQIPPYLGPLYVLVDSASGSGAELLARVVQIERRGIVLGDRTAGGVMEAETEDEQIGAPEYGLSYSFSITTADLVMSDGQRLEGKGVQPDQLLLPTAQDLAAGKDPVMAKATELAGDPMTPEEAGRLFPFEWEKLF